MTLWQVGIYEYGFKISGFFIIIACIAKLQLIHVLYLNHSHTHKHILHSHTLPQKYVGFQEFFESLDYMQIHVF